MFYRICGHIVPLIFVKYSTVAGLQPGLLVAPRQRTNTHPRQTCCSMQGLQHPAPVAVLAEGLEAPVQLVYLVTLLGFLVVGAYLVVRQVQICKLLPAKKYALLSKMDNLAFMLQALITRELEEAAKTLGDRVRQKDATCEVRGYASGSCLIRLAVACLGFVLHAKYYALFWHRRGIVIVSESYV